MGFGPRARGTGGGPFSLYLKVTISLSFSQGESVKYFLDNLEKIGQSVSPARTAEAPPITHPQQAGWLMEQMGVIAPSQFVE